MIYTSMIVNARCAQVLFITSIRGGLVNYALDTPPRNSPTSSGRKLVDIMRPTTESALKIRLPELFLKQRVQTPWHKGRT